MISNKLYLHFFMGWEQLESVTFETGSHFVLSGSGFRFYNVNNLMGTCATFSAMAPLARTEVGGAKVKNNGAVAVARQKMALIRAIFEQNFAYKSFF